MTFKPLTEFDPSKYTQSSVQKRLEAFFLDHIGLLITREQLLQVAKNPESGIEPENWHQRLSELRTDKGYTILSNRDVEELKPGEYVMPHTDRRETAKMRKAINTAIREELLEKDPRCQYPGCNLKQGDIDPIGGGRVNLQVDHMTAHDHDDGGDDDISNYQLLCGRHNVTKKNLWDDRSGKLNTYAILQALPETEKARALSWLNKYFRNKNKNS